jgi:hypothetical protein
MPSVEFRATIVVGNGRAVENDICPPPVRKGPRRRRKREVQGILLFVILCVTTSRCRY